MNVVDIAILVVLGAFAIKGLFKGLLTELCTLAGLVAGGYLSLRFHLPLAEILREYMSLSLNFSATVSFVLIFLGTLLLFLLLGHLLSRFVRLVLLAWVNRAAGGLFALLQGALLLTLLLWTLSGIKLPKAVQEEFKSSALTPPFVRLGESLLTTGQSVYEEAL